MQFMPVIFTFMLGRFAAGLVLYYCVNNSLTILQQWFIMRGVTRQPRRHADAKV
jgi:YidC/Oxa1 family membrane protein insertase